MAIHQTSLSNSAYKALWAKWSYEHKGCDFINILLVEDDNTNLKVLEKIIKDNFNEVVYCSKSYNEALEILETDVISIFLLDIDLGGNYSGIELAEKIRKIPIYKNIPIIFVTAIKEKMDSAINNLHCYGFITKPYNKNSIISMLKDIIGTNSNGAFNKLKVKKETFNTYVQTKDLIYIKAQDKDLLIYTIDDEITYKNYSLKSVLGELRPNFIRCHKKYIINIDFIKDYDYANDIIHFYFSKNTVDVGRAYKSDFKEALKCITKA